MHHVAIGRQFLLLRLIRSVQETILPVGHVVKLGSIRDITRAVGNLEAGELLAVNSIEVIVLASTHKGVTRWEVFEIVVVEFSNVNVKGLWSFALTDIQSIQCVHGFH